MKLLLGDVSINSAKAKVISKPNMKPMKLIEFLFQCFVRCFFKKEGFINDADEPQHGFMVDSLIDTIQIPRAKLKRIVDKCTRFRQTDPCEQSFEVKV